MDGDRRIDEICTGDYIWSYDTETGEKVKAKVTNVSVTEADVLVHVYTDDGEEIKTTMFHPFYVKGKDVADDKDISYNSGEWKAASKLSAGDELLTEDGKIVYVKEVRIERLEESIKVYNLEVEGLHTYYVGEGVLVHNMCVVDGEMEGNTLTDAQISRLKTLENTIEHNLKESDFSGTLRDLQGDPVPNPWGGYYDHLTEMIQSYISLNKIKNGLEGSLKNPNLSNIDRSLLQSGLDKANFYIDRIEGLFKPFGGI